MAAPNGRPGVFLREVAELGAELNTAFTKFITYRKVQDRRLENLYATLNITTGALNSLSTTLNTYGSDFEMKEDVTRSVAEKCKSSFETLLTLVNEGNAEGGAWKSNGTIGGQAITTEVDPWLLITMAVGGREDAKAYWKGLDENRDEVVELQHLVKYMVLKSMEDKATLTPNLEQELKKLKSLLPHIIQNRETIEKAKKAEADFQAEVEAGIERGRKKREEMARLSRRDSIANSEVTLRVDQPREPIIIRNKERDFDTRSVSSYCSTSSSTSTDDTPEEIYEEWILRWNPPVRTVNRSWGFLGLKFKNYYEDIGFWGTDPEFRTEEEMKEQEKFASADKSPDKLKESICKVLQALPKKGGETIDHLLDERTESSSHEDAKREWIVVAVRPKQKFPYGSAKKWGKDPLTTDWLVTIKGMTIDTKDRSRSYRRDDPFEKRSRRDYSPRRRYRSRSPPRRYPVVERIRPMPRDRSPYNRPMPMLRNPVRSPIPIRERNTGDVFIEDGFVQGKVVVGKIMTKKEAEEKMVGIWEGMVEKAGEPVMVVKEEAVVESIEKDE